MFSSSSSSSSSSFFPFLFSSPSPEPFVVLLYSSQDSKLTMLLSSALGGNSKASVVVCGSMDASDAKETVQVRESEREVESEFVWGMEE